jgi:hypothetical protein
LSDTDSNQLRRHARFVASLPNAVSKFRRSSEIWKFAYRGTESSHGTQTVVSLTDALKIHGDALVLYAKNLPISLGSGEQTLYFDPFLTSQQESSFGGAGGWPTFTFADTQTTNFTTAFRFGTLAAEWRITRDEFVSGISNFILPAYQQIIGLGPAVLPLIFAELEKQLDDWFWALRAITGENPVPEEHLGDLEAMRKDWLLWAAANGLQWED